MLEKERIIQDGMKEKLYQIEADQAEKMMNLALNMDPEKEIQKRLSQMKRAIEESNDNLDALSQSGAPSESLRTKKSKQV